LRRSDCRRTLSCKPCPVACCWNDCARCRTAASNAGPSAKSWSPAIPGWSSPACGRTATAPSRRRPDAVGYVGLLKAINNFDPRNGESLGAYALPWLSGEIKRHFRDRRWQIRPRGQAQELLLEMRPAEETLIQQLGRAPEDSELAARLGVPDHDVLEAR